MPPSPFMQCRWAAPILLSLILYSSASHALNDEIHAFLSQCHRNEIINGNFLIAQKGEIIYNHSFGYADIKNKLPLNLDTAFYLASVSKQFTAMAVLQLATKNQLSRQDTLGQFFPALSTEAQQITIEQLLAHSSGLKDYFDMGWSHPGIGNQEVLRRLQNHQQLNFQPGSSFAYSNSAYVLLAMIVEKVAATTFADYLQNHIFQPLGMTRTLVYETKHLPNRALGHNHKGDLADYDIVTTGDGGLYSTVLDLLKWDQALYNDKLLPKKILDHAFTPHILSDNSLSEYGLGWRVRGDRGEKTVAHSGRLVGFSTYIERNLETKTTVILLMNQGNFDKKMVIVDGIYDILLYGSTASKACNNNTMLLTSQ